jgi:hypothetical protein
MTKMQIFFKFGIKLQTNPSKTWQQCHCCQPAENSAK